MRTGPVGAGATLTPGSWKASRIARWYAKSETSKDIKEIQARLDQNVQARYVAGSPGLDSGPVEWPLFRCRTASGQRPSPIWRKRGTRKSRLETKTENEALSALLARL